MSETKENSRDNGGTRSENERRKDSFNGRSPDRRSGKDRRKGFDRRSGLGRRRELERRDSFRKLDE